MYSEFEDKRREIKAEKAKRIRELTDPDHAWDAVPEEQGAISPAPVAQGTILNFPPKLFLTLSFIPTYSRLVVIIQNVFG